MRLKQTYLCCLLTGVLQINFATAQTVEKSDGLKDHYKNYFPVGVAVSESSVKDPTESAFIISQFNSITPENAMKMELIHPSENEYNWRAADSIVDFAKKNKLKVRGHNLCWHEQAPKWLFYDDNGEVVSKDILLNRLKEHIYTVVGRYKGKIYAWDVVNEAVADDSTQLLRNSLWYKICGEDFIFKAFQYAHEADPQAILFYNDYNIERPEKRERVYRLLKKLTDAKVPVHAVGLEGHWSIFEPTRNELVTAIERFASLGLKIQVTELDVSVYKWEKEPRARLSGELDTYMPELAEKQARQYVMFFDVFRKYKNVITGITFWNVSDRHTWLDEYPVKGRKNYPLLFDEHYQPKPVYWQLLNFKK